MIAATAIMPAWAAEILDRIERPRSDPASKPTAAATATPSRWHDHPEEGQAGEVETEEHGLLRLDVVTPGSWTLNTR